VTDGAGPAGDFSYRPRQDEGRGLESILRALIRYWALFGGLIIIALVLLSAASALSNIFLRRPVPGDYELVKHFVAVAVFSFLPYCQLTGGNVTVDIFTEGMSARAKAWMALASALFAVAFSLVLLRQMSLGFRDYVRYPEMTATLHLPLWTAFPPILISLVLLLVASTLTIRETWKEARGPTGSA
jgi:TRAP-type C4-dicarboxylate transport system permease small subunit